MKTTGNPDSDRGSALVWALFFVILVAGMIVSHTTFMAAQRRSATVHRTHDGLSDTFARSGLTDALAWFRRQAVQPVNTFAPKRDPFGDPPVLDTLDPTVGLVREFAINSGLHGRYEVRTDAAKDISAQRGQAQTGTVWEIGARSYVYRRVDPNKPFDQAPNQIVSVSTLTTEMRGIPLVPPVQAAVLIDRAADVVIGPSGRIISGGRPALAFGDPTGGINADGLADLQGMPPQLAVVSWYTVPERLFGMRLDELRSFADFVFPEDRELKVPASEEFSVVFVDGDVELEAGDALTGRMVLIVNGKFEAEEGNGSHIEGIIYATDEARIEGPFTLKGMLVARNGLRLGEGTQIAEIIYDDSVFTRMKSAISRYRLGRGVRPGG